MQKTQILQDSFLSHVCRDKLQVTVFLMNGFQMHGVITGFDCFTVALESEGRPQLIYKHAISTVVPPKGFELELEQEA